MSTAEKKDPFIAGICIPGVGEAGKTGEWSDLKPVIDYTKCIPSSKNRPACFLCWLYCPDGVVSMTIPVTIMLDYCKGCGICAEECPANAIKMVRKAECDE